MSPAIARILSGLAAVASLAAGGLGMAGLIEAPLAAALAAGGGLLALVSALLPARPAMEPATPAAPLAAPTSPASRSAPAAAPPSEELRQLRNELARQKKLEEELVQARQTAEAAVMAKGEFLATMSHEIRTPLNGIIPLLDILLGSPLQADQREYTQTAYRSARELLRIVDDILDYSKLEANKLTLETVGLNLREVLDGVMRLMEKSAEAKALNLTLTIDPGVRLAVRGDPTRLRQVLTNLVSNAIKFTDRGSVSVHVSRRGESRSHHELRFEVRDTGVGISPEAADKLFKPFSQADASTTRQFGGTGLGLVICKRIVDLMGGQIGVESQPGKGSTFWFNVPMLKALGDIAGTDRGLADAKIMVLSADPAQQRRFAVSIPNWGARPIPASNTQEALTKLRAAAGRGENWKSDLLIADLPTIRTTYLALSRALQREPELASLRVMFLQGPDPLPPDLFSGERARVFSRTLGEGELRQQIEQLLSAAPAPAQQGAAIDIRPAAAATAVPTAAPIAAADGSGDESARIEPHSLHGHVLLVEDNPVNRQVAQRLLSITGLSVDSAENGQEALDKLAAGPYDAVLMDCQMPVLDGYAATRRRRELETAQGLPRIPIIAMTANAMVGDREKCLEAGMDDYLSKPINRSLLASALQRWVKPRPATATPPPSVVPASATPATAAPKAVTTPAINMDIVQDLREIMGEEFGALVGVFLEDAPKSLKRLAEAVESGDTDALVGPAHSLKSTSANLGAMELSARAKLIELSARQKTLQNPRALVDALIQEYRRADAELRRLLA